jgi:hypothetical protein
MHVGVEEHVDMVARHLMDFQAAYDLALSVGRIAVVATRPIAAPQQQYTSGIRSRFVILRGENRHVLDIIQPMMEGPTCTKMNTVGRGTREALSQASLKAKTSAHIWRSLRRLEMQVHLSSRPLSGSQYNKFILLSTGVYTDWRSETWRTPGGDSRLRA